MKFDPKDEWHVLVDLMLTIDCSACGKQFISPTLGNQVCAGDDAAIISKEAQEAKWTLKDGNFFCNECSPLK